MKIQPAGRRRRLQPIIGILAAWALLLAACIPIRPAATPATAIEITAERDATITAMRLVGGLVIEVRSESGIGNATIAYEAADVRDIILRFHLSGLENLTFTAPDGHQVSLSVSSSNGIVQQTLRTPGAAGEAEILPSDPWWMPVGIVTEEPGTELVFPLENGHFDVSVSRAFLRSDARAFTLAWVDFYR